MDVHPEQITAVVFYVQYGNVEEVKTEDMLPMDDVRIDNAAKAMTLFETPFLNKRLMLRENMASKTCRYLGHSEIQLTYLERIS